MSFNEKYPNENDENYYSRLVDYVLKKKILTDKEFNDIKNNSNKIKLLEKYIMNYDRNQNNNYIMNNYIYYDDHSGHEKICNDDCKDYFKNDVLIKFHKIRNDDYKKEILQKTNINLDNIYINSNKIELLYYLLGDKINNFKDIIRIFHPDKCHDTNFNLYNKITYNKTNLKEDCKYISLMIIDNKNNDNRINDEKINEIKKIKNFIKNYELKQEQLKQEQLKQEQLKQEQLKQEQLKQELIKKGEQLRRELNEERQEKNKREQKNINTIEGIDIQYLCYNDNNEQICNIYSEKNKIDNLTFNENQIKTISNYFTKIIPNNVLYKKVTLYGSNNVKLNSKDFKNGKILSHNNGIIYNFDYEYNKFCVIIKKNNNYGFIKSYNNFILFLNNNSYNNYFQLLNSNKFFCIIKILYSPIDENRTMIQINDIYIFTNINNVINIDKSNLNISLYERGDGYINDLLIIFENDKENILNNLISIFDILDYFMSIYNNKIYMKEFLFMNNINEKNIIYFKKQNKYLLKFIELIIVIL